MSIFTGSAGDTCIHPHTVKIHARRHTSTCQSIRAQEEEEETVTALSSSICTGTKQIVVFSCILCFFFLSSAEQLAAFVGLFPDDLA